MQHKKILITGGNSGIGLEAAKALVAQGAEVIIAARPSAKTETALGILGKNASHLPVDLADLESVRGLASSYLNQHERLDVLINNAGLFPAKQQFTQQGFEMQIGVNHLSHFFLTQLLLPTMIATGPARVVTVSSMLHKKATLDFDSFKGGQKYSAQRAYGQSKLANVLFAYELAARLSKTQVTSTVLHPGGVATDIVRDMPWIIRALLGLIFISPEKGAQTTIMLAAAPDLASTTGAYFDQCSPAEPSPLANDLALRKQLWDVSLAATGLSTDQFG
ncbi:MAG: SDR family oxidoreductase [Proteobacteria bacterium]|jgi:NAD(P)-dependent dehydrogenase (short-subunit alcohol dehydrogenase family)|nr:SDR family oxidoreductase [Pseudomonadota bacterium]